ncbi:hypothetical protein OSB04_011765 [Centaurea solstitialis]|uniref:Uncharacterized protein n=1 Tax=Centaurea solstitialis TaxID=347529 RepID=A0AA38WQA2_9ASTR|nr:hypothetical protein OSB04_011765 [Centaurea solstitialis]
MALKKQPIFTLSSTEAELVAATGCACQETGPTHIYCDNTSTIKLSKNPVLHCRSKHIDVKFHFLSGLIDDGVINLIQCRSEDHFIVYLVIGLHVNSPSFATGQTLALGRRMDDPGNQFIRPCYYFIKKLWALLIVFAQGIKYLRTGPDLPLATLPSPTLWLPRTNPRGLLLFKEDFDFSR